MVFFDALERLFPDQFNRSRENNYWQKIKQRSLLIVDDTIEPDPNKEQQIEEINRWIVTQIKPKDVAKEEMKMERDYEELCLMLAKHTNQPVKTMKVFEFYTLLDLIKRKKIQ